MEQVHDILPAVRHLESAPESSCAALVVLEALRLRTSEVPAEVGCVQEQVARAIDSIREAIAAFHSWGEDRAAAFGFVIAGSRSIPPSSSGRQASPRRTA